MVARSDELELWTRYRETRSMEVRNQLVERNLGLVNHVAASIKARLPASVDIDDLISDGTTGLLSAVEHYDPSRGVIFPTFASLRIRGAILDGLRDADPVPRMDRTRWKNIERLADRRRSLGLPPPTAEDVARELDVSLDVAAAELRKGPPPEYISTADVVFEGNLGKDGTLADSLIAADPDPSYGPASDSFFANVTRGMSRTERLVISLYYWGGMHMKQIGAAVGLSESRISQLHTDLIARLRARDDLRRQALSVA